MKLSGHFSLRELTQSQTALRKGIDNEPTLEHIENLTELAVQILEPTRRHFGKPISISSGYRSEALCEAIGSKTTSQHARGEAADFECFGVDNRELAKYIKNNLVFDQLILEFYNPDTPQADGCIAHIVKKKIENNHYYITERIILNGLLKCKYTYNRMLC